VQNGAGAAMIYFVDEDHGAFQAWIYELRLRGFQTSELPDAHQAFRQLWNADASSIDLAIIDVMLNPGPRMRGSEAILTEGLSLLGDLSEQNPAAFPSRAVLLTASVRETRRAAAEVAGEAGIELWDKSAICSPIEFADRVEAAIATRPPETNP
jgi:CheY-like chemotaxis protein